MASSITVVKVTVPTSLVKFHFATENLPPGEFTLAGGESQVFPALTPGNDYGVDETPNLNYKTTVVVSNDSPKYAIEVGVDEDVVVTFTNELIVPPVAPRGDWELHRFSMKTSIQERS